MIVASPFPANHGTPGSIAEMAEALARQGVDVHVITYHSGSGAPPDGVRLHRIPSLGVGLDVAVGPTPTKPLLDLLLLVKAFRVVRREQIDLVHGHNYEGALVGWVVGKLTRRPLVYSAINTMADELASYPMMRPRWLARLLAKVLDRVVPRLPSRTIAISDDIASFLLEQGAAAASVATIPLGIDVRRFAGAAGAALRAEHGRGGPLVLYTGVLARMQRIDYLLEAMRLVVEKRPDARLLVLVNIPKSHEIREFSRQAEAMGLLSHVEVITSARFEDVPRFLAAADVTVLSRPHCPGFPVKLLNYMAAGQAIAGFEGSTKCLKHLESAFVVKDHDWRALGEGILRLIEDPVLARRLGRNAHAHALAEHAWERLAGDIVDIYRQVLADRGAAA